MKITFAIVIFIITLIPGTASDKIELVLNQLSKPSASITWENEKADSFSVYFYKKSMIFKTLQNNEERRNFTTSKALLVLDFSAEYNFATTCTQNGLESERSYTVTVKTPATPTPVALSKNTALVLLLYFPNAKYIQLIVHRLPQSSIPQTTDVNTTELLPAYNNDNKSKYVAMIIDYLLKDEIIVVGNNSVHEYNNVVYRNVPLEPNTKYMFFQRTYFNSTSYFSHDWMVVETNPEEASKHLSGTKIGLIAAGVVFGVLIIIIGFCRLVYCQHSKSKHSSNLSIKENDIETTQRRGTITSIHIPNMKFSSLESAIERTPNVSIVKTSNNKKYFNVEYDVSAINDYYKNATFVPGFLMERDYIVLESLVEEDIDLLWKIVWENNVNQVVMIGRFEENEKCLCKQYFPSGDLPMVFNKYNVAVIKVQNYANMIFRTISLQCGDVTRLVYHYQFSSWKSDQAKPSYPSLFIQFVLSIIKEKIPSIAPIIVHSTSRQDFANVYTCVDAQMRNIVERNDVNIHSNVLKIRNQIKSFDEFIFVHDCVLEFIRVKGFEDIPIKNLSIYFESIKKENSKEISSEFNFILKNLSVNQKSLVADIKDPDSSFKPFDYNRVKVKNSDSSDYINASYVDTFLKKKAYVVMEKPKIQNIESFWQMVIKKQLWVVILFSEKENEEIESFLTTTSYNNFSLKLVSEKSNTEMSFRVWSILLTIKSDAEASEEIGEEKLITFYQYLKWPNYENLLLENVLHFLNFIQESEEEKVKLDAKRILLVSSFEGEHLGSYIALKSIAEEVESSGNVNVFRTIYTLRQQRQGIIQTEAEYALIYAYASELTKRLQKNGEVIDKNTIIEDKTVQHSLKAEQNVSGTQRTLASSLKNFIGHANLGFSNEEVA